MYRTSCEKSHKKNPTRKARCDEPQPKERCHERTLLCADKKRKEIKKRRLHSKPKEAHLVGEGETTGKESWRKNFANAS